MTENIEKIESLLRQNREKEKKVSDFSDLLSGLASTDEKKKALWKEIYENAISDRERASILFTEAYKTMGMNTTDHATLGTTMTKYLERMCKSNDQILQLADLISKAEQQSAKIDPDDLFDKILT